MMRERRNEDKGRRFQNRHRKGTAVILFALTAALYTGCGAADVKEDSGKSGAMNMASDTYSMGGSAYMEEENAITFEEAAYESGSETVPLQEGRKLIETVRLDVETKAFEQMMAALETQIQELGGYVESMETYNGSSYSGYRSNRSADLKVRVPSEKLDHFLKTVAEAGNIVRRSENVEDVTLSYVDMESRRDTLRTEQVRLLELLDRAENIEEIITIEERLSEVRYQLESMESQLRTMDNLVDYSTVYINISEVQELTPVEEPTVWERISEGFGESLLSIGHGTVEFGIWFLVHIPYLVIWGGIIAALMLFLRNWRRKKRQKLEKQLREYSPAEQSAEDRK